MSVRTVLVLLMSLICGTSAAVGVNQFLVKNKAKEAVVETTPIIVAAVSIPRGAILKPEYLRTQSWPAGLVPEGAVREMDQAMEMATLTPLVVGEPLLESKLSADGSGAAVLVRPGMRAYTIETPTNSQGVAGFVLPGNRVDVILTVSSREIASIAGNYTGGGGAWTLLQNVEILAADQRLDQQPNKDQKGGLRSVTLLVTPDMAAKLTLAQTMGKLNLSLRNDTDESIADTTPVTMRDLIFLQQALAESEEEDAETDVEEASSPAVQLASATAEEDVSPEILTFRGSSSGLIRVAKGYRSKTVQVPAAK